MLRPQQGIAERQAGGDTVVPQQGKRVARVAVAAADASVCTPILSQVLSACVVAMDAD